MLHEAAKNADRKGIRNIRFLPSEQLDSTAVGHFDLVHTFIVLQHIPPKKGEEILQELLHNLAPQGMGAVHVTFSKEFPILRSLVSEARKRSRIFHRMLNVAQSRTFSAPAVQMNVYSLNRIFRMLAIEGCHSIYTEFSLHGPVYGVMLYFQKIQMPFL